MVYQSSDRHWTAARGHKKVELRTGVGYLQSRNPALLFTGLKIDPEWLHQQTIRVLGWLENRRFPSQVGASSITVLVRTRCSLVTKLGCLLPNPVGLAAGFDKDGLAALLWSTGFALLN